MFPVEVSCFLLCMLNLAAAIIGGEEAKENEFPFVVAIQPESPFSRDMATGVLIRENAVLTHGQIILTASRRYDLSTWVVSAGTNSMNLRFKVKNRQRRRIYKLLRHKSMSAERHRLGLLWLTKPFKLGLYVQTVPITLDTFPENGTECLTVGWGTSERNPERYWNGPYAEEFLLKGRLTVNSEKSKCSIKDRRAEVCCSSKDYHMCTFDYGAPCIQNKEVVAILLSLPKRCLQYGSTFIKIAAEKPFIRNALELINNNAPKEEGKIRRDEL